MEVIKFAVDKTPYACWDWELKKKNLDFLKGIDAEYFRYIAEANAVNLDGDDKQRAALAIRLAYSQGLEVLFALLCSAIQAPQCVVGWMLSYKNSELECLISKINKGEKVFSRFKEQPIGWYSLAKYVHSYLSYEPEKLGWIHEGFGKLWSRFSREFTDEGISQEYNSAKHGLRTSLGGFFLRIGFEEKPGVLAPSKNMRPLGGSVFGTSYFRREKVGNTWLNFRPRHQSRNWDPQNLIHKLVLLSMSIKNVASFLRILNGEQPEECEFTTPSTKEAFDQPWRRSVGITSTGMDTVLNPEHISPCTKDEVLESYD